MRADPAHWVEAGDELIPDLLAAARDIERLL